MKILEIEKITDCKNLNLFSLKYKDRINTVKSWIFASRSEEPLPVNPDKASPDAVVIVPYHVKEKKIVIIKEFRVPLAGYQYGFPAGLIDHQESIEEAGRRELFEETGLKVVKVLKKSPGIFSSSGMTDESVSLLFVECDGIPTDQFNEDSEDIEVMMLSKLQAVKLLEVPGIKFDVKSWIVLDAFAQKGSL